MKTALAAIVLVLTVGPDIAHAQARGGFVGGRPGMGRPGFVGGPNFGGGGVGFNRPNPNFNNRPNINYRGDINTGNITNINVQNSVNAFNRPGVRPGGGGWGGWGGYGGYRGNPYQGLHQGWVNGAWNGNYQPGWGGNNALALGAGIGVAAWGVGSLINSWGVARYSNPYYVRPAAYVQQPVGIQQAIVYDYSRPLDLQAQAPAQPILNQAEARFDSARRSFLVRDYPGALALADQALVQTPNDPMLHEFRSTCLFAIGRYDEAAVPLYTVLTVGPGWDWTTLIGLYPDIETYTAQLRGLEAYCNAYPRAASARFVLASLYLTQGNLANAATRLREVIAIQPQDRLSAQLLASLAGNAPAGTVATQAEPPRPQGIPAAAELALPTSPVPPRMLGLWTASPAKDVTISLAFDKDNMFTWKVTEGGQVREFRGRAALDNQTLALSAADTPPMVAQLSWRDDANFLFKAAGAPPEDPGLDFRR